MFLLFVAFGDQVGVLSSHPLSSAVKWGSQINLKTDEKQKRQDQLYIYIGVVLFPLLFFSLFFTLS